MKHKFIKLFTILITCAALLQGCGMKTDITFTPTSEDCQQGNLTSYQKSFVSDSPNAYVLHSPILKTAQGYYDNYLSNRLFIYYHDIASGKDILLCNKPECKHDGNEYCVATNAKYEPLAYQIYDGCLYVAAKCLTDERLEFKLLRIAPDGSSLTEVATYYNTPAGSVDSEDAFQFLGFVEEYDSLLIHRNKAILPLSCKVDEVSGKKAYGTAILDLETKEVTYADDTNVSVENLPWLFLSAHGDYVYYVRVEDKKRVLHRRSLTSGADESFSLLSNFTGDYCALSDDSIAYLRSRGRYLNVFHPSDGHTDEHTVLTTKDDVFHMVMDKEKGGEVFDFVTLETIDPTPCVPALIFFDGTYLFVLSYSSSLTIQPGEINAGQTYEGTTLGMIHVYNDQLEEIALVPLPNPNLLLNPEGYNFEMDSYYNMSNLSLHFMGNEVIYVYRDTVFSCDMESFLSENPDFQYVYKRPR